MASVASELVVSVVWSCTPLPRHWEGRCESVVRMRTPKMATYSYGDRAGTVKAAERVR